MTVGSLHGVQIFYSEDHKYRVRQRLVCVFFTGVSSVPDHF